MKWLRHGGDLELELEFTHLQTKICFSCNYNPLLLGYNHIRQTATIWTRLELKRLPFILSLQSWTGMHRCILFLFQHTNIQRYITRDNHITDWNKTSSNRDRLNAFYFHHNFSSVFSKVFSSTTVHIQYYSALASEAQNGQKITLSTEWSSDIPSTHTWSHT